jgi:lysophospholipase L1-like esterase
MRQHARACDNAFYTHGVVGSHVTEWVQPSWLAAEIERAAPTVVMVSMGGNDFGRHDADRVAAGVERFVAQVRQSGARLLWISPPTMPFADRIGVRGMWRQAIGERNVDWFPTEDLIIERVADRVHPTIAEYGVLSATLWRWLAARHSAERKSSTIALAPIR